MQMLRKYAYRSSVDMYSTATANLKLLHKTLRKDKIYKEIFQQAEKTGNISELPTIFWLVKSSDLQARIISLGNFSPVTFTVQDDELSMFLVISGKIECLPKRVINRTAAVRMAATDNIWQGRSDNLKTTYKAGNTFINELTGPCTHQITSLAEISTLLEIRLPAYDSRSKIKADKLAS
jgi:hypothetical protein